jgi:hypothetical protein
MKKSLILLAFMMVAGTSFSLQSIYWKDVQPQDVQSAGVASITTTESRLIQLDINELTAYLKNAPAENSGAALDLNIPMPDGSVELFRVYTVPVVHPAMQAKYPGLYTFAGQGVTDKSAIIRLDITMRGFHAMTISSKGSVFIDPYNMNTVSYYKVYDKTAARKNVDVSACGFDAKSPENEIRYKEIRDEVARLGGGQQIARSNGAELRTYRTAIACTGEYAVFHGGTVPGILAAMVTSLNRVSGVYELECSVRLTLIPNNDTLIFLNANTDPYSNNNGGAMLGQNQTEVSARIGSANYDIGHVFSTGGGGIAGLGVVCSNGNKARGVTGSPSPINDPFDIDYVAHEMGHQFGGNHTFNGNAGACSGNINTSTAYEPGSGTTIMAYAGICGTQNTQNFSDPYFHTASFDEIIDYTTITGGNNCPVITVTGNTPPVITSTGGDHAIPYNTPFILEGAANDPDGDTITYCWEQYDLGPSGAPSTPALNAPSFRSVKPTLANFRYFPKILSTIANASSLGEKLPTYARNLQFRLTVRDNRANGGGVTYDDIPVTLNVINTGAPFLVTSPNTAVQWPVGSQQNVTWNVVGTDVAPISAANVDIFLSTDGGFTYPVTLATGVPNNGQATVTVPNNISTTARVMVRGAGNVFFDISNTNFTITASQGLGEAQHNESVSVFPNPSNGQFQLSMAGDYRGEVEVVLLDLSGRRISSERIMKQQAGLVTSLDFTQLSAGAYLLQTRTENGVKTEKINIQ